MSTRLHCDDAVDIFIAVPFALLTASRYAMGRTSKGRGREGREGDRMAGEGKGGDSKGGEGKGREGKGGRGGEGEREKRGKGAGGGLRDPLTQIPGSAPEQNLIYQIGQVMQCRPTLCELDRH